MMFRGRKWVFWEVWEWEYWGLVWEDLRRSLVCAGFVQRSCAFDVYGIRQLTFHSLLSVYRSETHSNKKNLSWKGGGGVGDLLFSVMDSRSWALISRHRRSRTPARCFHHSRDRSHSWYRACNVSSKVGGSSNGSAEERRVRVAVVVIMKTMGGRLRGSGRWLAPVGTSRT